jgi:hemolysin III
VALVVFVPLLAYLAIQADGVRLRAGVVVYAAGLCSMFAVSTTYHRWVHTIRSRAIWQRADHATIYAAIAATCTPFCLALLATGPAVAMLVLIWAAALVGATVTLTRWRRATVVASGMYIANGWAGILLVPPLLDVRGVVPTALLVAGGLIYTLGAIGFACHWPTLRPSVFSYHEVWHVCTLAAAGAHLAAVWLVVA